MRVVIAMLALTWPFWLLLAVTGVGEWWQARTVRPVSRATLERIARSEQEDAYRAGLRREFERG